MKRIVLGTLFGDEGKGLVTRWLVKASSDPIVIRFSGGPQSAHTIMDKTRTHICSSFGAGVLEGIPTHYIGGFIDPICLRNEALTLPEVPKVTWNPAKVQTIHPCDVMYSLFHGSREKAHGTCGKGIYRAWLRGKEDPMEYYKDLLRPEELDYAQSLVEDNPCPYLEISHSIPSHTDEIYEGTQGLLLDMDHGYYPHVTPSKTGLNGLDIEGGEEVWLVVRSYLTRHGNGYDPKGRTYTNPYESNHYNPNQGPFKTGDFEPELVKDAIRRHRLKDYHVTYKVVVTCMDVFELPEEKIKEAFKDLPIEEYYGSYGPYSDEIKSLGN